MFYIRRVMLRWLPDVCLRAERHLFVAMNREAATRGVEARVAEVASDVKTRKRSAPRASAVRAIRVARCGIGGGTLCYITLRRL